MAKLNFIYSTALLAVVSMSCTMKKNMDEMHSKTVEMSRTTNQMNDQMTDLKDESSWLSTTLKQGDSSKLRDEAFQRIIEAKTFTQKTLQATKYFYAFEFQIFKPSILSSADDLEIREELKRGAVLEFTRHLSELMTEDSKIKISATKGDNESQSLNAIAAALHQKNPFQHFLLKNNSTLQELSFLDILQESLQKVDLHYKGVIPDEALSPTDREVFREEQIIRYILKLRYKVLPVIVLGRISNIQDGFWSKLAKLTVRWTPQFKLNTDVDDNEEASHVQSRGQLNVEQIRYVTSILEENHKLAKFLITINEMPSLDKGVLRIYKKMNLKALDALAEKGASEVQKSALEDFKEQVIKLIELN